MSESILLVPILLPLVAGLAMLLIRKPGGKLRDGLALVALAANLVVAVTIFGKDLGYSLNWVNLLGGTTPAAGAAAAALPPATTVVPSILSFSLHLDLLGSFVLAAVAGFGVLVSLYCWKFLEGKAYARQFYCYMLISIAMAGGAVLADHLVTMLFFWEGMLLTTFGIIAIGGKDSFKTAVKAFVIVGITDLCLMVGIILVGKLTGTLSMAEVAKAHLSVNGLGGLAFVLLMIGAIAKAGSMPFHSWIPDAAIDAPLPFMAILPASLEKMLGIYLLTRISVQMFNLQPGTWVSWMMMTVGAITILFAVMMALVQKNYKRLLSYHAISQVGYMVLGIGTAVPIGIVGGLFHMINNAMYKSCLFLTGGAAERQAGSADLQNLGGLGRKMPITFLCFMVTAAAISGFPLTNGFYSKELLYDAALNHGHVVFYLAALLGTVLTAASFLKLGHAAYLGKLAPENEKVKEAPAAMLLPMVVIAAGCLVFGLWNALPLEKFIQPAVGGEAMHEEMAGLLPHHWSLAGFACLALVAAFLNHLYGVKKTGSGLHAVDHIHHAPILHGIYDKAERRWFDPYDIGMGLAKVFAWTAWVVDRIVDWVTEGLSSAVSMAFARGVQAAHTGSYAMYVVWSLIGAGAVLIFMIKAL